MKYFRVMLAALLILPSVGLQALPREDWARLMVRKGVRPGESMTLEEWNNVLDRLTLYGEAHSLDPKKEVSDQEWAAIVKDAGISGEAGKPPEAAAASAPATEAAVSAKAGGEPPPPPLEVSKPPSWDKPPSVGERPEVHQKVSLDLKSMDVVEVLKILSRQSGLNIVVSQRVNGRVTVFLKDVAFWSAMDNIMSSLDLAYVAEDGVVNVVTAPEFERLYGSAFGEKRGIMVVPLEHIKAQTAKDYLEPFKSRVGELTVNEAANSLVIEDIPKQIERLFNLAKGFDIPLDTKVFKLNYATVDELLSKVAPLMSRGFGNLQSDKRTNTLVIRDNPERIREIAEIVAAFDAPHKTVQIDAKIIQVNLSDDFRWGINWERAFHYNQNANNSYSGVAIGNTQVLPLSQVGGNAAPGFTARITSLGPRELTAALNFLETVGKTNLLSSPRITALNNEQAKIVVASQVPKITKTVSNIGAVNQPQVVTDNVTFENVGLELFVTPAVGDDGFITMKIKPKVTALESTITTAEGSSIPVIRTSEAETTVLAKDGVTVLIAGLIEDKVTDKKSGLPILAHIPLIGWLFGSKDQQKQKTELVIFLTPHIVSGAESSPEAQVYLKKVPQWETAPPKVTAMSKD